MGNSELEGADCELILMIHCINGCRYHAVYNCAVTVIISVRRQLKETWANYVDLQREEGVRKAGKRLCHM